MAEIEVVLKKNVPDSEIYEAVNYIESTGTQWIQLGKETDYNLVRRYVKFAPNPTYDANYKTQYIYNISTLLDTLWLSYDSTLGSTPGGMMWTGVIISNNNLRYSKTNYEIVEIETNENAVFSRTLSSGLVRLTPEDKKQKTPTGMKSSDITIFSAGSGRSKIRYYEFKFGNNSEWVSDLVPCVRKSDQVAGVYDKIKGKFYTNAGTGDFIVGTKTGELLGDLEYALDKFNGLKSVQSLSQSTGEPKGIYYGTIPSSGSIKITDNNCEMARMLNEGIIGNSNLETRIFANGHQIQNHISTNSDYSVLTQQMNINCSNVIDQWENQEYPGYIYDGNSKTAYELLTSILASLGFGRDSEIPTMLLDVAQVLQSITIKTPFLPRASYRATIDKFCQLAQMQVFQADDGSIKFISARPLVENQVPIYIPLSKQLTQLDTSFILSNKYDAVDITPAEMVIESDAHVEDMPFTPIGSALPNTVVNEFRTNPYASKKSAVGAYSQNNIMRNGVRIELYCLQGYFDLPKTNEQLTEQYLDFSFSVEMSGKRYTNFSWNNIFTPANWTSPDTTQSGTSTNITNNTLYNSASLDEESPTWSGSTVGDDLFLEYGAFDSTGESIGVSSVSMSTQSRFTIADNGNYYTINFYIPVGYLMSKMIAVNMIGQWSHFITGEIRQADEVTVTITSSRLAKKDFETMRIGDGDNAYTYPNNELLAMSKDANDQLVIEKSQYYKAAQNILEDYKNGIVDASIEVVCDNYYSGNNLVKNWENGEVIEVGDLVNIENNVEQAYLLPNIYRVTGREFIYSGVPKIKLQLQQAAAKVSFYMSATYPEDETNGLIHSEIVGYGNKIKNVPYMRDSRTSTFYAWRVYGEGPGLNWQDYFDSEVRDLIVTKPYRFVAIFHDSGGTWV